MAINALPPELCSLIFSLCLEGPYQLAHVCTRWRTLAVGNPTLWARIPADTPARALPLWLDRSANLPLHISVDDAARPLLPLFLPYLHRIQSLSLRLTADVLPALLGRSVRLPCLTALELSVRGDGAPSGLLVAPRLRCLYVSDLTLLSESLGSSLGTITSLTVQKSSAWRHPRIFGRVLASCAQLQSCSLVFPLTLLLPDMPSVVLAELRSLTVEWPYLFDPVPFFRALRAPQLRTLRLVHGTVHLCLPSHVLPSLRPLIQSAPDLRELSLQGCHRTAQTEARDLLADCPALESLTLASCQLAERFLAPLTPKDDTDTHCLCPRLTHLAVSELRDTDVRPIICFARARTRSTSSRSPLLKELALDAQVYSLTRYARILMLHGLLNLKDALSIVGPFGDLLKAQPLSQIVVATSDQ